MNTTLLYKYVCGVFGVMICLFPKSLNAQVRVDGEIVSFFPSDSVLDKESVATDCIKLYQKYISAYKNSTCPMYPSCSNYGLMLFKEKPFFNALFSPADRIIRCSHDRKYYATTYAYGRASLLDYPNDKILPKDILQDWMLKPHADCLKGGANRDSVELFVNYLINNRKYQEALWEIERNQFFGNSKSAKLYDLKLMCYEGLGQESEGIYEYETIFPDSIRNTPAVMFSAARLYDRLDNDLDALRLLEEMNKVTEDVRLLGKVYVLRGIIEAKRNHITMSEELFESASKCHSFGEISAQSREVLLSMSKVQKKNPSVARLLSIFPGGGYLYTGHKGSALASLAINALLMYSTYTSIKSKNYGMASLCGFLSFSFYIGNIKGAGKSAVRYNERLKDISIERLYNINNSLIY